MKKLCTYCGNQFNAQREDVMHCSVACMRANGYPHHRTKKAMVCATCLKEIEGPQRTRAKFCNKKCEKDFALMPLHRFMTYVDIQPNGCWIWKGPKTADGYGRMRSGKKEWSAHRFSFVVLHNRTAVKDDLHHICETRSCVNPDHLMDVTDCEHSHLTPKSASSQNRNRTHCIRGHEFSPENTYLFRNGLKRVCKTCCKLRDKARNSRSKQRGTDDAPVSSQDWKAFEAMRVEAEREDFAEACAGLDGWYRAQQGAAA